MTYASPEDVGKAWRPLTAAETALAETLIEYVEALVRRRIPNVEALLTAGTVDPILLRLAVIEPVKRVLKNPDSARQRSEGAGPFNEAVTLDSAISSGALYLSDADLAGVLPAGAGTRVGSVRLHAGLGWP